MNKHSIHINGKVYDAVSVVEELISLNEAWKIKGMEFIIQLLDPSEFSVKFHTSGTTGIPKEIGFSKSQIFKSAQNTNSYFGINNSSKLLLCLPTDFVAGRLMMARALISGAQLIWLEPSLNPLKNVEPAGFAAFTPAQVATILADKKTSEHFNRIEKVIIGGGEISYALEMELMKCTNQIFATYGMTETLTHVAARRIGDPVYHGVYKEAVFSVDQNNCLVIDLPFISSTKIITNDVVELLDNTSFVWKGRFDHVMNSGGIKLYPEEIEMKLIAAGIVKEGKFYIASQKHDIFGETPVIVMLNESKDVDVAALLTRINELLNKHEYVKHVLFFDKFETTATGKLKRERF